MLATGPENWLPAVALTGLPLALSGAPAWSKLRSSMARGGKFGDPVEVVISK
jgi:hypothetical protein